jgi:two-component system OmpR family sensor kinase/two-component system sensor histidine kinase BaeS
MMWQRPQRRPPWWPPNEPWPPPYGSHAWRRRRVRFARRMAFVFACLVALMAIGAVNVVSWILAAVKGSPYVPSQTPLTALPFMLAVAIAVVIVVGGAVTLMRRVGVPLADVVSAAGRVAAGDYGVRIGEHGPASLRSVARAFNRMAAQLQAQDEQRRHLMADIAHELRTPLTVMQGQLEGLVDGIYARDDARLNDVLGQARLLGRLVEDLDTLAQAERGTLALKKEPTDLGSLVDDAAAALSAEAAAKHIAIRVADHDELPAVEVDPVRIREVLTNLLSNALRHSPDGASVTVEIEPRRDAIAVSVRDTGGGIPPDVLSRIFDRFYKGPASHGSGLGLTIARNFVEAHGGRIAAESRVGEGTVITFTLPREKAA